MTTNLARAKLLRLTLLIGLTLLMLFATLPPNRASAATLPAISPSPTLAAPAAAIGEGQQSGGNPGFGFSNNDAGSDPNASRCISVPTTNAGTTTSNSNFNFTNPGDYISFVAGTFGRLASAQIISTAVEIVNWGSGCADQAVNFVSQTAAFNTILVPSSEGQAFNSFFWQSQFIWLMLLAVFLLEIVVLSWKRRNGEYSDFDDAFRRVLIACIIMATAMDLMDWLGTVTNTLDSLFTDTGINPLTLFDPTLYTTTGKDAVLADPFLDALAAVTGIFTMQMLVRYITLLLGYFIMPLSAVLICSKVTEQQSLLLIKTYVCTMLVQPLQLAVLYLCTVMATALQGSATQGDKTISLLTAIAGVSLAIALPKLIGAMSGGMITIGAMAMVKAGGDMYQNSTAALGQKAFNFAAGGLTSMATGGLMGAAMGGLSGAFAGFGGGGAGGAAAEEAGSVSSGAGFSGGGGGSSGSGGGMSALDDGDDGGSGSGGGGQSSRLLGPGSGGGSGNSSNGGGGYGNYDDGGDSGSSSSGGGGGGLVHYSPDMYDAVDATAVTSYTYDGQVSGGGNEGGSVGSSIVGGGGGSSSSLRPARSNPFWNSVKAGAKAGADAGLFTRNTNFAAKAASRASADVINKAKSSGGGDGGSASSTTTATVATPNENNAQALGYKITEIPSTDQFQRPADTQLPTADLSSSSGVA